MKIVVASGKGGVGKSMLASSLAMLFAKKHKVVAIDCDVDAPNLHLWLGQNEKWDEVEKISTNERPIIDHTKCNLCGQCVDICAFGALSLQPAPGSSTYSDPGSPACNAMRSIAGREHAYNPGSTLKLNSFFCEGCGACEVVCPQKAIKMKKIKNAEIRIKKDVCGFPLVSAQLYPGQTGSGKIVEEIKKRAEEFDHQIMILDSPAGTGCPVIATLKDANFAVLVTEPTPSGLADLKRVLTVVNHFQIPYGVVINKWDINPATTLKIKKEFHDKILGKITYDQKIFQAIASLIPIMETDLKAKGEIKKIWRFLTPRVKNTN